MFGKLLIFTIGLGLFIGFAVPINRSAPTNANFAETQIASAVPPKPVKPVETVLTREGNGHFYVDAEVNGQLVHFIVDTGATTIALTQADAKHVGIHFSPADFTVIGRGVSGDVKGQAITLSKVSIDQKEAFYLPAVVVADGLDTSLLGQSFLSKVGTVVIDGDRMILR
jgi:aspartyl protease family protein